MMTLKELNELSSDKAVLLLVRVLNTSDLSFFHSVFKDSTIIDIINQCRGIIEIGDSMGSSDLTSEERAELKELLEDMEALYA